MESSHRAVREGLVVGLIGYAAVAAFYAAFDLLASRGLLYTPDLLGKAVFRGWRDPSVLGFPIQLDFMALAGYNGLHLLISIAIGFTVTGLVLHAERRPAHARLVGLTIVAGFVVTVLGVGALTSPMRPLLPWWSIALANGMAVLVGGWYFVRKHPGLWSRLVPVGGEAVTTR